MGIEYRDYGAIGESIPPKKQVEAQTSQVYKATHDRAGNRLSFRHRSYISFSYGGKIIEDFGLIAITDGDRLERDIYADFSDITENHETLDGQIYWGTHFSNNKLNLVLTTDGITAKQLDDFKQWFVPGEGKELILMEHPNRAIIARIAEPPKFSMLPFSTQSKILILGKEYTTEVTLFKGDISLSFVMDEPYWYAKNNLIPPFVPKGGANDIINLDDDPYQIKKILEREYKEKKKKIYVEYIQNNLTITSPCDFIDMFIQYDGRWWYITCDTDTEKEKVFVYPSRSSNNANSARIVSLYGGTYTLPEEDESSSLSKTETDAAKDYAKIIAEDNIPHLKMIQEPIILGGNAIGAGDVESRVFNDSSSVVGGLEPYTGARVLYYGYVALDLINWQEEMELYNGDGCLYLFYSGTAPSKPTLQFTFTPSFDNNGIYINLPRNQYSNPEEIKNGNYNYIAFNDHKFYFTTPSLITGYNQAINIVQNYEVGQSVNELITLIKENINEYYARAWAIYCIKSIAGDNINVSNVFFSKFKTRMKYLISDGATPFPITCFFDSKHGTAIVTYSKIRKANGKDAYNSNSLIIENEEQNAGDMVKSDYLTIEGRCYPSFNGYISHEECHIITTDFSESNKLKPVIINFQNMYY